MCFVNSQNVRDLRQPFGGTKASGTGREGGTWSYEVFLEPKNVCVSLGRASHSALGRVRTRRMSLYQLQKFLYDINRDARVQQEFRGDRGAVLGRYELTDEERAALERGDIGLTLRAGGQRPAADALRRLPRHALAGLHRRRCATASPATARCAPASMP